MAIYCVVTALYKPNFQFLAEAAASLAAQELPPGWELVWQIRADGSETNPQTLPDDVLARAPLNTRYTVGKHQGVQGTRNLALAEVPEATLVRNLDQDDLLPAGAVLQDIEAHSSNSIGWCVSATCDYGPAMDPIPVPVPTSPGPKSSEAMLALWGGPEELPPAHPSTMCLRADLAVLLGGWMAMPDCGDTGLLLAAVASAPGFVHHQPGLLYRRHADQVSNMPAHNEKRARVERTTFMLNRARLLLQHPPQGYHPAPLDPQTLGAPTVGV